jgi:hypothetical protein
VLARVDRPTPVAAHGDVMAWSERVPGTETFRLVVRAGGATTRPPIPTRDVPFDVDLGPGADGTTTAVYSRCAQDPPPGAGHGTTLYLTGRGCDVFTLDLARGTEARVAQVSSPTASEAWPTVWRSRIAFARAYDRRRAFPYLYVNDLSGQAASRRMPGGQRAACRRLEGRRECTDGRRSAPAGLELHGRRLAFAWRYVGFAEGFAYDLRLDDVLAGDGAPRRLDAFGGGGLTAIVLGWPALEADRIDWSRACFGDGQGCPGRRWLLRSTYAGPQRTERFDPRDPVFGHDRAGGATVLVRDLYGTGGTECRGDPDVPGGTCEVVRLDPAFTPAG